MLIQVVLLSSLVAVVWVMYDRYLVTGRNYWSIIEVVIFSQVPLAMGAMASCVLGAIAVRERSGAGWAIAAMAVGASILSVVFFYVVTFVVPL